MSIQTSGVALGKRPIDHDISSDQSSARLTEQANLRRLVHRRMMSRVMAESLHSNLANLQAKNTNGVAKPVVQTDVREQSKQVDQAIRSGLLSRWAHTALGNTSQIRTMFKKLISPENLLWEHSVIRAIASRGFDFNDAGNTFSDEDEGQRALRMVLVFNYIKAAHLEGELKLGSQDLERVNRNLSVLQKRYKSDVEPALAGYEPGLEAEAETPLPVKRFVELYKSIYCGALDLSILNEIILRREHFEQVPQYIEFLRRRLGEAIKRNNSPSFSAVTAERSAIMVREMAMLQKLAAVYKDTETFLDQMKSSGIEGLPSHEHLTLSVLKVLRNDSYSEGNVLRKYPPLVKPGPVQGAQFATQGTQFIRSLPEELWFDRQDRKVEIFELSKIAQRMLRLSEGQLHEG